MKHREVIVDLADKWFLQQGLNTRLFVQKT